MKSSLAVFLLFTLLVPQSQAQLVDVVVEEFGSPTNSTTYPDGFMTYRIYARLQDADDRLMMVYADDENEISGDNALMFGGIPGVESTSPIWNSNLGALEVSDINYALCGIFPEVCYDSFITLGGIVGGVFILQDNNNLANHFHNFEFSNPEPIYGATWFTLDGYANSVPVGNDHRVFIMQITCEEDELMYAINLVVKDDGLTPLQYVHTMQSQVDEGEIDFTTHGLVYPPQFTVPGCNDPIACNYSESDTNAVSCVYSDNCEQDIGCMNPIACNYEPLAIFELENTCIMPGCTDPLANNYNPNAECFNDETCSYPGCTDPACNNYDPYAYVDDGSCECPPPNDEIENAESIGDNTEIGGTMQFANPDSSIPCIADITSPGVWYKIIGVDETIIVSTCSSQSAIDTKIQVFDAGLNAEYSNALCIASNDDACAGGKSAVSFWGVHGNTYYILVQESGFPFGWNFTLTSTSTACPETIANDLCEGATALPPNTIVQQDLCCSNAETTECLPQGYLGYGVWYKFEANSLESQCENYESMIFTLTNISTEDFGMTIYEDVASLGCNNLTAVACCPQIQQVCSEDLLSILTWNPTSTYYFFVYNTDPAQCGEITILFEPGLSGCMDPNASNFLSCANYPDDSCIFDSDPVNDVCAGAFLLTCDQEQIGSTSASTDIDSPIACSTIADNGVWYQIEGNGNALLVSVCSDWINTRIQLFSGTCENLFCVGESESGNPACEDDAFFTFLSEIGTTYFIYVSGEDADGIFSISVSCEEPVWGCMLANACNYIDNANLDDNSCFYDDIHGHLFYDTNGNGIQDFGFLEEPFISNTGVILQPLGIVVFTDQNGYFEFPEVSPGNYTLEVLNLNESWTLTTPLEIIQTPECNDHLIGIFSDEYVAYVFADGSAYNSILHCDDGMDLGRAVFNLGNLPFDGTITLTCDPLFSIEESSVFNTQAPDVIESGTVVWNINDLNPFTYTNCQIHINGPGAEYVDQVFTFTYHIQLFDEMGTIFYDQTVDQEVEVLCSYDPNDKFTSFPGYTEEHHFVSNSEEIEYIIRFQNTGNFAAQNVVIRDSLDLNFLDINSFSPVFGSHNFMTTLLPDGTVNFVFNNIQLPDSTSDPEASQGFVIYKIKPLSDVQHLDVIHNEAYIYFDSNPAIITNETWHTIMDCDSLGSIVGPESCCVGDVCEFYAPLEFIESYTWSIEDEDLSDESIFENTFDESGLNYLILQLVNPICDLTYYQNLFVNPLPETSISTNGLELVGPDGVAWQWYHDGEPLFGETDQFFSPTDQGFTDGFFSVWVTNEYGCSILSDEIYFLNETNNEPNNISVFPNPSNGTFRLNLPPYCLNKDLLLYDISGKILYKQLILSGHIQLDISNLSAGTYYLEIPNSELQRIPVILK